MSGQPYTLSEDAVLWGEEVRERFNAPELNLARYIKDGIVTDADNGE
ncbi:hypothetical protein [Streptomyces mirabilis]